MSDVRPLWAHQQTAIDRARELENFALFFEMGTGKTRTCIEILNEKNGKHKRILKTLVLTPQVVCFNWKKEFGMFSNIPQSQILVLHGSGRDRIKMLEKTPSYFVVVCNYETLGMAEVFEFLKKWSADCVVLDESQRIKNPRAMRTKRSIVLGNLAKYRYILTGTPILQDQADLFAQYLFLDKGELFGKNPFTFRHKYFTNVNANVPHITWPKWRPKQNAAADLREKVMSIAMEARKSDCLDLPPLVRQTIHVGMTKRQEKAYKEMKDDFITFVNSKAFTAQLAITKALRLQQIVSGFLMGETDGGERIKEVFGPDAGEKYTPREKALSDLLEDGVGQSKIIIWACWKENHASIGRLLVSSGIRFVELNGSMGAPARAKSIQSFREDDKVRVLVGSPAAAGLGINLIESNYTIYFSRNFSLEQDLQSMARNFRGGSEIHQKITRVDLCCAGTIDEQVTEALAKKEEIAEMIIRGEARV